MTERAVSAILEMGVEPDWRGFAAYTVKLDDGGSISRVHALDAAAAIAAVNEQIVQMQNHEHAKN